MASKKAVKSKGTVLPKGWREIQLGEVCFPRKERFNPVANKEKKICIELENLEKNTGRIIAYSSSFNKQSVKTIFFSGDVLYGKLRPNLKKYAFPNFSGVCASEIWALKINTNVCIQKFVFYIVQSSRFTKMSCRTTGTKMPRADWSLLRKCIVHIPSFPEQKAIASLLETWDTAIEKTEALIAAKEKQFQYLISLMITSANHRRTLVSAFTEELSKRNHDKAIDRVLSVTNHSGFILPEDQFQRRVASANLSNYKIVFKGQYAYNPARINIGSIARLDNWDVGVLSPMYVVLGLDSSKVNSDYFWYWLQSNEARQCIKNSAQGSVRKTVSFDDLGAISIPLPSISTQTHIAKTLNTAKNELTHLKKLTAQYSAQKRGLMQKLLTGEWRIRQ